MNTHTAAAGHAPVAIDKIDKLILSSLQADARLNDVDIAERVHLSSASVGRRLKALNEKGVITGLHLKLDSTKLGLSTVMVTQVQLEQHTPAALRGFEQFVQDQLPFVIEILPIGGSWDFWLRIIAVNNAHYGEILDKLGSYSGLARVRSYPVMGRGAARSLPLEYL